MSHNACVLGAQEPTHSSIEMSYVARAENPDDNGAETLEHKLHLVKGHYDDAETEVDQHIVSVLYTFCITYVSWSGVI